MQSTVHSFLPSTEPNTAPFNYCLPCLSTTQHVPSSIYDFDSCDLSTITPEPIPIMVTGAPESTLNDGGRQATSPPSDIVSRSELNDILKANNAAIIAALQRGTKQPAVPHETDTVTTTATASTDFSNPSHQGTVPAAGINYNKAMKRLSRCTSPKRKRCLPISKASSKYNTAPEAKAPTSAPVPQEQGIPLGPRCKSVDEG